jgi:two-component system, OmpR family, response regulator
VQSGIHRILVVEDSQVLAERLGDAIRDVPGVVLLDAVDTEDAAVACIKRGRVDLVILDLQLKEGTGFGVLRRLRGWQERPVVIVLTNFDLPAYRTEALWLGATMFLDKARAYSKMPEILDDLYRSQALARAPQLASLG